jgi:uncharacterized LabA/DUF88 family protein
MMSRHNTTFNNIAYIDGQNLYMGTTKSDPKWYIDLARFRIYLRDKYKVNKAYYYLGYVNDGEIYQSLYESIQSAGFLLVFREHNSAMMGAKKGNVDSDIIFDAMKRLYKKEAFDKIVLVSGDGDYKSLVTFLINEKRFSKLLFPNKRYASSLYKQLEPSYFDYLDSPGIKNKIESKKRRSSLGNEPFGSPSS